MDAKLVTVVLVLSVSVQMGKVELDGIQFIFTAFAHCRFIRWYMTPSVPESNPTHHKKSTCNPSVKPACHGLCYPAASLLFAPCLTYLATEYAIESVFHAVIADYRLHLKHRSHLQCMLQVGPGPRFYPWI